MLWLDLGLWHDMQKALVHDLQHPWPCCCIHEAAWKAASAEGTADLCGLGCCHAALAHRQLCGLPGSSLVHVHVHSPTPSLPAGCPERMKRHETASVPRWASLSMWSCCRNRQQMQRQHRWCSLGTTGPTTERGRRSAKIFRRHRSSHGQPLAPNLPSQSCLLAQSERGQHEKVLGQCSSVTIVYCY